MKGSFKSDGSCELQKSRSAGLCKHVSSLAMQKCTDFSSATMEHLKTCSGVNLRLTAAAERPFILSTYLTRVSLIVSVYTTNPFRTNFCNWSLSNLDEAYSYEEKHV